MMEYCLKIIVIGHTKANMNIAVILLTAEIMVIYYKWVQSVCAASVGWFLLYWEKKDGKAVYSKLIYNRILMTVIAALNKH